MCRGSSGGMISFCGGGTLCKRSVMVASRGDGTRSGSMVLVSSLFVLVFIIFALVYASLFFIGGRVGGVPVVMS